MTEASTASSTLPRLRIGLSLRVLLLAAVLVAEKVLLNQFVDFGQAQASQGLGALVRETQHWVFRLIVAFTMALALFTYVEGGQRLKALDAAVRRVPIRTIWILLHVLLVALLVPLSYWLYRVGYAPLPFAAIVVAWVGIGAGSAFSLLIAMAPWALWWDAARALGILSVCAVVCAVVGVSAMQWSQMLWSPTASLTFDIVHGLLSPLLPNLRADPATLVLRTERFAVEVSYVCSGLEGIGLILGFTGVWLFYFRREYIFPRSLILIPIGVLAIFILNAFRIAALVLIGNAGYPDVAVYGFHSQAGWIAFNAVACALVFFSRRSAWLNRTASIAPHPRDTDNPTATYLLPLLSILAAGALSHAISGRFETFYPLRLIAVAIVMYSLRRSVSAIDWRFTWRGPAVGILIFVVWLLSAHLFLSPSGMPLTLSASAPALRIGWVGVRLATAIIAVPFAEELAYRGYLMRRLTSSDFESVGYQSVHWPALIISAVAFGVAHGALWLPGILAGIAYGSVVRSTGRIGEGVAAHATSNALIAACVLGAGQWQLW
jgi:exosortase E/protease (VPEID-CTERM system)